MRLRLEKRPIKRQQDIHAFTMEAGNVDSTAHRRDDGISYLKRVLKRINRGDSMPRPPSERATRRSSSACPSATKTKPSASAPVSSSTKTANGAKAPLLATASSRPASWSPPSPSGGGSATPLLPIRQRSRPPREGRMPPRSRSARSVAERADTRGAGLGRRN